MTSSFIFLNENRLKVSVTDYRVLNLPEQLKLFYFLTRGQPHLCIYAQKLPDSTNCSFIKVDMSEPCFEYQATNVHSWHKAYSTLSAIESIVSWHQWYTLITPTAFMPAPWTLIYLTLLHSYLICDRIRRQTCVRKTV